MECKDSLEFWVFPRVIEQNNSKDARSRKFVWPAGAQLVSSVVILCMGLERYRPSCKQLAVSIGNTMQIRQMDSYGVLAWSVQE